jgi:hypothetical protein
LTITDISTRIDAFTANSIRFTTRCPMKPIPQLGVLALVSFAQLVSATTVIPPTFDELVDEAQVVFLGEVAAKRSRWANEPLGRAIITDVTFRVEDVFKGDAPSHLVLEFLGGSVDGYEFRVSEMTDFAIGDRDVLFLESREQRPSPLVGMNYGRFAVMRDGVRGLDTIADFAGQPLVSFQQIGAPEPDPDTLVTAPVRVPMTLGSFARAIRARVQAAGERRPQ